MSTSVCSKCNCAISERPTQYCGTTPKTLLCEKCSVERFSCFVCIDHSKASIYGLYPQCPCYAEERPSPCKICANPTKYMCACCYKPHCIENLVLMATERYDLRYLVDSWKNVVNSNVGVRRSLLCRDCSKYVTPKTKTPTHVYMNMKRSEDTVTKCVILSKTLNTLKMHDKRFIKYVAYLVIS